MRNILIGTLILPFVFVACKHEDEEETIKELCYEEDTGYDDTGDTADSGVDTGETGDTAIDSGSDDSGNDTSLPVDTGDTAVVVDTGVETGTADTATEDTGSTDDTAVPVE